MITDAIVHFSSAFAGTEYLCGAKRRTVATVLGRIDLVLPQELE